MFPPGNKPPDLDAFGQPVKQVAQKPPDLDDYGNPTMPEQRGFLGQVWDAINEPLTDLPSRIGRKISGAMESIPTIQQTGQGGLRDWLGWADASAKGFFQGATEGAGDLASSLTSPLNIGTTLATGGSNVALRAGLPQIAKGLQTGAKVVGSGAAAHGGMEMGGAGLDFFDPNIPLSETAGRFGRGAVELAGGTLAARHQPHTQGPILSRLWPEQAPESSVADLLPQLRASLDRDAARSGKPSFAQQVDPNFAGGEGDPMLAGSQPYQPNMPAPTKLTLKFPTDPQSVKVLQNQGYDFVGMDEKGGMLFERKQQTSPDAPDITQFEDEPQFSRVNRTSPEFAFMDPHNFPEGPEPFFHLPDGSTVSQRELVRRGIEVPQLPDEMLGIGRQFPGVEAQEIGPVGKQPIDLNQALLEMESDMARPVGRGSTFAQQVLPEDVDFSRMRLPEPETPVKQPQPVVPPHMNEFQPDIRQTNEPVLGGTSPEFTRQVTGEPAPLFDEPQMAKTKTGQVKIGADIKSLGKILGSSLYQGDIKTIATKELVQNALDAVRPLGPAGKIDVGFDRIKQTLFVNDNGKGMTPDEVATILTDLGSSGKRSDETAIGGFGLAKASFLLGGEEVNVVTTARQTNGQIVQTTLKGSPDQLLQGVQPEYKIMPEGTPTGTQVQVKVPKNEQYGDSFYDAQNFVENISKFSDYEGQINMQNQYESRPAPIEKFQGGEELGAESAAAGDIKFIAAGGPAIRDTGAITIYMRNKGMFQGRTTKYLDSPMKVPDKIIVDIDAKVPEGDADYPFTANRETLRGSVGDMVDKWINENIITPNKFKRSAALKAAYEQMPTITTPDGLDLKFFDTGSRYTPEEFAAVQNSPVMHQIGVELNRAIEVLQAKYSDQKWANRLEHVGFVFDDNLRGIHIPNPGAEKSMILVNPLQLMSNLAPDEAAAGFAHVILHEFAHVDPQTGRGHSEDFTTNLANIYERFGARETVRTQDEFLRAVTDPNGSYSPEVQELLQGYQESRGRDVVKEDILSRTGVGSATTGSGQNNVPPGGGPDGTGTPGSVTLKRERATPDNVKRIKQQGYEWAGVDDEGNFIFQKSGVGGRQPVLESEVGLSRPTRASLGPKTDIKKTNPWMEAYNFPRALVASMDFSAPLRQGIGLMYRGEFYKALPQMFKAWATEDGFRQVQDEIASRALFRKRADAFGKELPSFADDAGLKLTDLTDLSNREEIIASTWAEKIPGVRRSNRAYTAFLNRLRADTFEALVKDMDVIGVDAKTNVPLARAVAEFVNTATGRGSLGKLEPAANVLGTMLFAPRLIASRIGMFAHGTRALFDPQVYMMGQPSIRREYLKSLFAIAAMGNAVLQLGKFAGGEVSMDPSNSDFGKLKIGNTRLDPWGGFQQYLVAASRLMSSTVTSSTTGKQFDLSNPQGPYDPTHADIITRFARGKVHPVIGFAWSLLSGRKEMSGEKMKFGLDFSGPSELGGSIAENAIAQRFIPLLIQDLYELAQNDELPPQIKGLIGTLGAFGMGQQTYGPKTD